MFVSDSESPGDALFLESLVPPSALCSGGDGLEAQWRGNPALAQKLSLHIASQKCLNLEM